MHNKQSLINSFNIQINNLNKQLKQLTINYVFYCRLNKTIKRNKIKKEIETTKSIIKAKQNAIKFIDKLL